MQNVINNFLSFIKRGDQLINYLSDPLKINLIHGRSIKNETILTITIK